MIFTARYGPDSTFLGRFVLRNAYRGVESLTWLARRMRDHEREALVEFREAARYFGASRIAPSFQGPFRLDC